MQRVLGVFAVALALTQVSEREGFNRAAETRTRLGYTAAASERQLSLEQRFRGAVSTERLSTFHAALTKEPHLSGTRGSVLVTDYLRKV
ncbi:MAG TPA: hypothetical protein VF219_23175, partial [Vicinamibacterales bacterium]